MKEKVKKVFSKYNIKTTDFQLSQFEGYYNFLIEQNNKYNLTAITEQDDVVIKHFLDSVLPYKIFPKNCSVVDIGSGAGFPALPLKIIRPDLNITMVDSLNKRINFLNNTIALLKLKSITAIHARAEDFAKTNREKFDIAVARAVASLNTLVEYLLPLIKVDGTAIIYKSTKLEEELQESKKAIKILGGEICEIKNYKIEEGNLERNVLIIKKITTTPPKYPRDKNKPKLCPIK